MASKMYEAIVAAQAKTESEVLAAVESVHGKNEGGVFGFDLVVYPGYGKYRLRREGFNLSTPKREKIEVWIP